eukprot:TRINITY_DN27041_c0_g1_i1.p1 TRINITY_DN27041_c0_g1~~TRINITY_DN27041_c0_g1_i1.p1  ORF type:complete len:207 (+),score=54.09 TRINITY_DN27041_c0_g1_i1:61-621(+)
MCIRDRNKGALEDLPVMETEHEGAELPVVLKVPILIVDDTPFNIVIAENLLKGLNLDFHRASNGAEAVEAVVARGEQKLPSFALILMDCNMPVMDGYQATTILKQMMKKKEVPFSPVVAMTAFVGEHEVNKCKESGMDDYLSKPCPRDLLVNTVKKYLSNDLQTPSFFILPCVCLLYTSPSPRDQA